MVMANSLSDWNENDDNNNNNDKQIENEQKKVARTMHRFNVIIIYVYM